MLEQILFYRVILLLTCGLAFIFAQQENTPDAMEQLADLLGLSPTSARLKRQPSLSNSAAKFLLEVYKEISEEDEDNLPEVLQNLHKTRRRRALTEDNFITPFDRREIELSNNIITFASRPLSLNSNSAPLGDMLINFNLNEMPSDLELTHAVMRLYQDPQLGQYSKKTERNCTISVYQRVGEYMLSVATLNTTTKFSGWLELNVTNVFNKWLHFRTFKQILYGNDLLVGVTLHIPMAAQGAAIKMRQVAATDVGLVPAQMQPELLDVQPFIIGYFNGPDLMTKMKQRSSQQRQRCVRHADSFRQPPAPPNSPHTNNRETVLEHPKGCERHNFTLDFKFLGMEKSVIAPKTFEAYYCFGECNFPLGTPMNNATNHAIVQTLIHLKRPNLPKPCCVPVKLASVSILYSINEDSVNLMRFSQIVAKECGCR